MTKGGNMFKSFIQWTGSLIAAVFLLAMVGYLMVLHPVVVMWTIAVFGVYILAVLIKGFVFKE